MEAGAGNLSAPDYGGTNTKVNLGHQNRDDLELKRTVSPIKI